MDKLIRRITTETFNNEGILTQRVVEEEFQKDYTPMTPITTPFPHYPYDPNAPSILYKSPTCECDGK